MTYFGVNFGFAPGALDAEGDSPNFAATIAGTGTINTTKSLSFNNTTQWTPNLSTNAAINVIANSGGYAQNVAVTEIHNGTQLGGLGQYSFVTSTSLVWSTDSSFANASGAGVSTQSFYIYGTDAHMWANPTTASGSYSYNDGNIVGFSNLTIANFHGLPTSNLASGLQFELDATNEFINLYVGATGNGAVAMGNGVWINGNSDNTWSTNGGPATATNWSGGIPMSAGYSATFNGSETNYTGTVTVDQNEMIGSLAFTNASGKAYTLSGAGTSR